MMGARGRVACMRQAAGRQHGGSNGSGWAACSRCYRPPRLRLHAVRACMLAARRLPHASCCNPAAATPAARPLLQHVLPGATRAAGLPLLQPLPPGAAPRCCNPCCLGPRAAAAHVSGELERRLAVVNAGRAFKHLAMTAAAAAAPHPSWSAPPPHADCGMPLAASHRRHCSCRARRHVRSGLPHLHDCSVAVHLQHLAAPDGAVAKPHLNDLCIHRLLWRWEGVGKGRSAGVMGRARRWRAVALRARHPQLLRGICSCCNRGGDMSGCCCRGMQMLQAHASSTCRPQLLLLLLEVSAAPRACARRHAHLDALRDDQRARHARDGAVLCMEPVQASVRAGLGRGRGAGMHWGHARRCCSAHPGGARRCSRAKRRPRSP